MTKKDFLQIRLKGIDYIQSEKCTHCTRSCCEAGGCLLLPMDIEPFSTKNVIKHIDTGKFSIIARFFPVMNYQLRLQSREIDSDVFDINKPHTQCALLSLTGCSLSEEERPTYALTLIPGDYGYGSCRQAVSQSEIANMWHKVQRTMQEVVEYYSGGKDSLKVVLESFDKVAIDIYQTLLDASSFKKYSSIVKNSIVFGQDLYEKLIRISKVAGTTDAVILKLVELENNGKFKDYNGYDLARRLLQYRAYGRLQKPIHHASIEEKVQACIEFNQLYLNN